MYRTLLPLEIDLLRDYGKVFFYEVNVFEAGAFVGTYFLHPYIETLYDGLTPEWRKVTDVPGGTQLQGNLPFGTYGLFYYTDGTTSPTLYDNTIGGFGNKCNSFELVFDAPGMYKHIITGSMPKTLTMDFLQHHQTFWQHSALWLRVH